jgi:integrase
MTVHRYARRGRPRLLIDIPYRHRLTGKRVRFRKDADIQTAASAQAEERPHPLTDPVAPSVKGKVWGEPSLLHALHGVLTKLGMAKVRVHDLRHHFVTEAFKAGGGAPTVRDLAGHKHMHVTARYAHSDDEAKRAVIAALDKRRVS